MPSNVDLRGQGARRHHTAQISYLDATWIVGTPLTGTFPQPTGLILPTTGTNDFQIGFLPFGARILRASLVTGTAIAGGTATLSLGNAQGGAQFVSAATFGTAGFVGLTIVATNTADYVMTEQTPLWARIVITGTLTAVQSDLIFEYATVGGPTSQA